ncbi:MAG: hypothetical protein E6H07_01560 [Bacteroidetes bacterium]|nr:MAG: hypothetical protein E6H07_01560 [Bacteroidota bacterium]
MKIARLSIVTENQNNATKAENLAKLICKVTGASKNYQIDKYSKFENSYKFDFILNFHNTANSITESLDITNKLCSPWLVFFKKNEVELIFNKSDNSAYSQKEFNIISWGHWQVEQL